MSEYGRELYRWRKEHHICVECGKNDAFYKRVRCPECLEKRVNYEHTEKRIQQRIERTKKRIAARIESGVCVECGAELAKDSNRLCEKHLMKHRAYHRVYEKKRRDAKREKSLDQIALERSERGRKTIAIARNSVGYRENLKRQKKYWNKKYWGGNPHG